MKKGQIGTHVQSRLSFREFMLLILLGIVLVGYLLVYQLILPKWEEYQDQKSVNDIREITVNRLQADFEKKADFEKELSALKENLVKMKVELPAYRAQEELLQVTDRASADTALTINVMTFDLPTVVLDASSQTGATGAAVSATPATAVTTDTPLPENTFLVVDQQVGLSFQGTYASLYAFLSKMEQNVRKVYPKDLTLSANESGLLAGTMKLSFLSFVDASNEEAYQFDLQMTPGRLDPFTPYPGYDNGSDKAAPAQTAFILPDFSFKINNYLDNAPKVILDAVYDAQGSISSEDNKSQSAKLVIKGDAKSYTHTLTLGGNTVATVNEKNVRDNVIRVQIISQPRRDDKDLVGLTLDVDNQSGVPVDVIISKDDAQNPRFRLGKTTGTVNRK